MEIIFNKSSNGAQEVKGLLSWINRSMKFENFKSDIRLETPRLIEFIGKETYEAILAEYIKPEPDVKYKYIIEYAQLFILCMAYISYASNNDLQHSSTGRKQYKADNESAPWEWQLKADEGATMRRAYKALDRLIDALNSENIATWKESDAFAKANNLLITSTDKFDQIYPIDNSGQLYYRMVPFMESIETEEVNSIMDEELIERLKTATDLNSAEKLVKLHASRMVAYRSLAKAYQVFPLEMFSGNIDYAAGANYKHTVTGNKTLWFDQEADSFENALQVAYAKLKGVEEYYDLPDNSDTDKKFANL